MLKLISFLILTANTPTHPLLVEREPDNPRCEELFDSFMFAAEPMLEAIKEDDWETVQKINSYQDVLVAETKRLKCRVGLKGW